MFHPVRMPKNYNDSVTGVTCREIDGTSDKQPVPRAPPQTIPTGNRPMDNRNASMSDQTQVRQDSPQAVRSELRLHGPEELK